MDGRREMGKAFVQSVSTWRIWGTDADVSSSLLAGLGDPRDKACLTSSSIPLRSTRSAACPSCKGLRSRAREGRPGSGPSASSRSRGALSSGVASKGGGKDGFRTTIGRRAPFDMVSAGDHCSRRMSRQMDPFALILRRTSRHQHPRLRFPRFACCFPRLLPGV